MYFTILTVRTLQQFYILQVDLTDLTERTDLGPGDKGFWVTSLPGAGNEEGCSQPGQQDSNS